MDIIKILQKQEFKDFYNTSKTIYKFNSKFPYHSAIAVNSTSNEVHSIKFYYGTYSKIEDLSLLKGQFDINDIKKLYELWDIDNLDNKGLSFCIKYYPKNNEFKYQVHCKVRKQHSFNNIKFSNTNCRYGIGIEKGEIKNYINVTGINDKILVSKLFGVPDLVFFDELEYCELGDHCKVITSYNNQKTYLLRNYLLKNYASDKEKHHMIHSSIDQMHVKMNLDLRNFGIYKDAGLYSMYFYLPGKNGEVDTYEPFLH